ncbi:MAG: hypothetical protein AB1512_04115 [Thermodesulfobacteriota bacterium]
MKPWPRVDFKNLVHEVMQPQWGQSDLSIWGGQCVESELPAFLRQWPLEQLPYRIWEYASELIFEQGTLPQNAALLGRARLFGEGGDLELRREGVAFAWRFVGPAGVQPPAGDYGAQDYLATHPGVAFHRREETALLWGEKKEGQWVENRVGGAKLSYPGLLAWQRVQVHYRTFSLAGRVEFVWFTRLSEWKEGENG